MNEEEKKSIEYVKAQKGIYYKTVINLIEKQQKEIEDLKDKCKELIFEKQELTSALLDSIPENKIRHIRDKAECMDYYSLNDVIDDLSKLLGE